MNIFKRTIQKWKSQQGQTLVEVMTVMFVLVVGIMGALGLTSANVRNEHSNLTRLIASNLSREGVELARSLRDSNWLKGISWDTGIGTGSDRCAYVNDTFTSFTLLDCGANGVLRSDKYHVYKIASGGYVQDQAGPQVGDTTTAFYRKISFKEICEITLGCNWSNKTGIRVTSEVGWQDRNNFRTIEAIEELYNWR